MTNNIFRLFISSTFNDFKEERRLLQTYVFPKVQEYCKSLNKGYIFQPIDLRWGVSQEAGFDQKTLELCLEEVRRSKFNPHPNFLIMSGNRYGWIPLPNIIEQCEFEEIIHISSNHEVELLHKWYQLDENQIPVSYILKVREDKYKDPLVWQELEDMIRKVLQEKVKMLNFSEEKLFKYFTSATEHEVIEGVFKYFKTTKSQQSLLEQSPNYEAIDYENVFSYIRDIKNLDYEYHNFFFDEYQANLKFFQEGIRKSIKNTINVDVNQIKCEIKDSDGSLMSYSYKEIDNEESSEFVKKIYEYLKNSVDSYISQTHNFDEKSLIDRQQESFKDEKIKNFIGRNNEVISIIEYATSTVSNKTYILHGQSGMGKSAVMAKAIDDFSKLETDMQLNPLNKPVSFSISQHSNILKIYFQF